MNINPFSISGVKGTGVRTQGLFWSCHKCTPYNSPPCKVTGSDRTHTISPPASQILYPGHLPAFHCLFSHGEVLVPAELIYVNISTQCLAGDVTLPPLNPSGSWLLLKSQTFNDGDIQLRLDLLLTIIIDLVGLMHFFKNSDFYCALVCVGIINC